MMRRFSIRIAAVLALGLWVGLLASPLLAAPKYDYDPSVDFTKYHSFRFFRGGPESATSDQGQSKKKTNTKKKDIHPAISPLAERQIEGAVKTALEGKGLRFVDQGQADLGVAYHTGRQRDVVGYGWGPRYRGPRKVVVYEEGTLTIDLIDRAARELVWRGSIADTIKDDPEKLHEQIANLVEKILKKYPPKK